MFRRGLKARGSPRNIRPNKLKPVNGSTSPSVCGVMGLMALGMVLGPTGFGHDRGILTRVPSKSGTRPAVNFPLIDVDLMQTVTHGLPGSAMPSWEGILTDQQRKDVLAFVTEELVKDRDWQDDEFETLTVLQLDQLQPKPATPESIKRGSELVQEKKCIECHGMEGRGDGNAFNLKDDWGFAIQPADWHKCWNFRGSRQDPYNVKNIFRTFSTGINGTPMPSFADNTSVDERWDIANYVNSLCERVNEINIAGGQVTDEIATTAVHKSGVAGRYLDG